MTPVHNGRLTLTSLRNEIVGEFDWFHELYGSHAHYASEPVKRRIWQQITEQVFDPLEIIIIVIGQKNDGN